MSTAQRRRYHCAATRAGGELVQLLLVAFFAIDAQQARLQIQIVAFELGQLATAQTMFRRQDKEEQVATGQRIPAHRLLQELLLNRRDMG